MATNTPGNAVSIFSLLEALRRRKFLIIAPAILLSAAAAVYAYCQPNVYRAQALIAAVNPGAPEYLKEVAQEPLNLQEHLWTIREVLFSRDVLDEAAHELAQFKNLKGPVPIEEINELKSRLTVKVESGDTFHIFFEGGTPQEVVDITNKAAESFVERASAKHQEQVKDTKAVIDQQIDSLKSQLAEQDKQVRSYKERAVNELPQAMDSNSKMVENLKQQYDSITSKIADDHARHTTVANQIAELEKHDFVNQPVITEKTPDEQKLDALRIQENELAIRYTPKHPELQRVRKEIRDLEAAIVNSPKKPRTDPNPTYQKYTELRAELQGIEQRIDAYKREQISLKSQIEEYRRRFAAAPSHERYLAEVDREYHVRESQLHDLLDKRLNTDLSGNLQKSETGIAFALAEPASLPSTPASPQRARLILMGLAAGLGLGLGAAFLLEQNDTTFSNVDDFQSFTSVPILTAIPTLPVNAKTPTQLIVAAFAPDSVAAEQYRLLAMKIQQHCVENGRVVMLTSAVGDEGKSLTACNLAQALASMSDGPILLVDGDMRKPRIHEYLEVKPIEGRGFYQLLHKSDPDYTRHCVTVRNIQLIPGSTPEGNPVAVLSSHKTRALFERLKHDFQYVIVDAPPTLPVADSHLLAGLVDKVLFVVRARKTPRELFQHAVESFDSANLIGAVLNDVDYQRNRYAYAYEYYKKSA